MAKERAQPSSNSTQGVPLQYPPQLPPVPVSTMHFVSAMDIAEIFHGNHVVNTNDFPRAPGFMPYMPGDGFRLPLEESQRGTGHSTVHSSTYNASTYGDGMQRPPLPAEWMKEWHASQVPFQPQAPQWFQQGSQQPTYAPFFDEYQGPYQGPHQGPQQGSYPWHQQGQYQAQSWNQQQNQQGQQRGNQRPKQRGRRGVKFLPEPGQSKTTTQRGSG